MTSEIIKAAEEKFGEVIATGKHDTGDIVLLIKRTAFPRADHAYMTIRANRHGYGYHHGHYDMTEAEARESFFERTRYSQMCA